MCSVQEYDDDDLLTVNGGESTMFIQPNPFSTSQLATVCAKCHREDDLIHIIGKNNYCKTCFLTGVMHKFKATLGKSKTMQRDDSVLIAHCGNENSIVLLHLIKTSMCESTAKRLKFKVVILYIDDGIVEGATIQERELKLQLIAKQAKEFGFDGYGTSLSQCFKNDLKVNINKLYSQNIIPKDDEALLQAFKTLPDGTARKDLLCQLRRKILVQSAKQLNCNKIFLSDCSMNVAIGIFNNISQGRGSQIALDVGFADLRYGSVHLLRPLREFTKQEIKHYLDLHFNLMNYIASDRVNVKDSPNSIQTITESFLNKLNSEFSGTVSTIFRIGEKLDSKSEQYQHQAISNECVFCNGTIDITATSDIVASAANAIKFSKLISLLGTRIDPKNDLSEPTDNSVALALEKKISGNEPVNICNYECYDSINTEIDLKHTSIPDSILNSVTKSDYVSQERNNCHCTTESVNRPKMSFKDIEGYLCHGCRLIFFFRKPNSLPEGLSSFLLNTVQENLSLAIVRKEIADFLL